MPVRIGINGFGRIGRLVLRALKASKADADVVLINDLGPADDLAHLLKYDSVHGKYPGTVEVSGEGLVVDGDEIRITAERDPSQLPWDKPDVMVDIVLESTGIFRKREQIEMHFTAGAKKVLLSAPAKDPIDATIVLGVNDDRLKPEHRIVSNASCTTNCLAPIVKALNDEFGIEYGLMTTVHGYTNDQKMLDMIHSDKRRMRAAALNIIPTSTGAAKAVGMVIPELDGKLNGGALRVPVPDGSCVDLVAALRKPATADEVNAAVKALSDKMPKILGYTEDPIASSDIIGDSRSSIFDAGCTMAIEGSNLVKVISWYDNEWGYSNRCVDLIVKMATM